MGRSRKAQAGTVVEVAQAGAASAAGVSCLALGEAMLDSTTRTVPGQWYTVDRATATRWRERMVLWSREDIDALWNADRRVLSPDGVTSHYVSAVPIAGARKVLQLTHYDPGCAVYRYHSAANVVPGVVSAFARIGHSNPYCELRQWDIDADHIKVWLLLMTADIVHCHMDYPLLLGELGGLPDGKRAAITYHGSIEPQRVAITYPNHDARMRSIVFGARPYHRRFNAHWLPIPIPVADYAALARTHVTGPVVRVAHSPTRAAIKGTAVLREVVAELQREGLALELVCIEDMPHGEALRRKATCDITFDSFWLGMQGSGLEGAAMGQMVIAGSGDADYERVGLAMPWTVADDAESLRTVLRRAVTDATYRRAEAARVLSYVTQYHDYPVVGARYADLLHGACDGAANAA